MNAQVLPVIHRVLESLDPEEVIRLVDTLVFKASRIDDTHIFSGIVMDGRGKLVTDYLQWADRSKPIDAEEELRVLHLKLRDRAICVMTVQIAAMRLSSVASGALGGMVKPAFDAMTQVGGAVGAVKQNPRNEVAGVVGSTVTPAGVAGVVSAA